MISRENNVATPALEDNKEVTATCRLGSGPWVQSAVESA